MNKSNNIFKEMFNKADIILALVLIILGICSLFVLRISRENSDSLSAVISVSGKKYGTYPLSKDMVINVDSEYGSNVLTIENGGIYMSESGCPNHDCEHFGKINSQGQMIICIPNRVVVTIEGNSEPEIDAVLY